MNLSSSAIGIKEDKSYIVPNYKINSPKGLYQRQQELEKASARKL